MKRGQSQLRPSTIDSAESDLRREWHWSLRCVESFTPISSQNIDHCFIKDCLWIPKLSLIYNTSAIPFVLLLLYAPGWTVSLSLLFPFYHCPHGLSV